MFKNKNIIYQFPSISVNSIGFVLHRWRNRPFYFTSNFIFNTEEGIWKYLIKLFSDKTVVSPVNLICWFTCLGWPWRAELYSNVNYRSHQDWLGYWKLLMDWFWDGDGATRGGNNGTTNTKEHSLSLSLSLHQQN